MATPLIGCVLPSEHKELSELNSNHQLVLVTPVVALGIIVKTWEVALK